MSDHTFLAFDLGATSGRAVSLTVSGRKPVMREIHRFPNRMVSVGGRLFWDIYGLYMEMEKALRICASEGIRPCSIGIDTWGVDFGFVASDGVILGLPRSYRDPFTSGAPEEFFRVMPREEVYRRTGIQIMDFNSLYQLDVMKRTGYSPLENASGLLFVPDLLVYMLTGSRVCEYTVASTSQLLDPVTKDFCPEILDAVGLGRPLFGPVVEPGTVAGVLDEGIARSTGVGRIPVISVAGHDTASAVAAVPALDGRFAYLSSGTWSLMGIETCSPVLTDAAFRNNFTNEGGVEGSIRFLRNITGMWLLEKCMEEWSAHGRDYSYAEIVAMAEKDRAECPAIDPDSDALANPQSMTGAIAGLCEEAGGPVPRTDAEFVGCIFRSLAGKYRDVLDTLRGMSPFPIDRLHIIGGGSRNALLNRMTADAAGIPVYAGPSEATAIGNCMVQARAAGLVKDRWKYRQLVAEAFPPEIFMPGGC